MSSRGPPAATIDPATVAHRWSSTFDEAEQLARELLDAAPRVGDMTEPA